MSDKIDTPVCDTAGHAMTPPVRKESDSQIKQAARVIPVRPIPAPALPAFVRHA